MRLPGWIKSEGMYRGEDGQWYLRIRIRRWHPGLWVALARDEIRRRRETP